MRIATPAAVVLSLLLFPGGTARAQAADTVFAPSHLAAARALLSAARFEESAVAGSMVMFDQQVAAAPETAVFRDVIEQWSREVFGSEEAKRAFARAWAEELSEEDLLALAAFYRSPLGMRAASGQAALARKGAEIGRQLASAREAELQQRIMERVAELEGAPEPQ